MRLAVVDDEVIVQKRLKQALVKENYLVETYSSGEAFLKVQSVSPCDLVFLDVILPGIDGMETLRRIKSQGAETEVILMTGRATLNAAIEAVKQGAFHYLAKPLKLEEVRHLARKALEHRSLREENRQLKEELRPREGWGEMVGVSPAMQEVFAMIRKVAPLDCQVLIQGESGTGKELVARAIHRESKRRDQPFLAFNCAGFTEELIASELFGYERGAFTGAVATKFGLLETAHRGTVFMDEIGDMPPAMQAKLLRVIQERQIFRVGGSRPIQLDLRFIAASNKDLKREIQEGRFREDLFFRLNVVQITLPALKERPEDIPLLIQFFLSRYSRKFSKRVKGMDNQVREALLAYSYPGNVRELKNIIERAVALAGGEVLTLADLPPDLREYAVTPFQEWPPLEDQEREYIRKVLAYSRYNIGQTAHILNLPRTTLWRKMKKYGLAKSLADAS
ncbi:MAG: sigma-54-dependent Fis family transcriptional regulator [Deltaproteobacteria bacterium]|nr:MAG: sigma-54-dependent Fis family transcriptional regulator [Deltaproteobacteria bacterium]